MQSTKQVREIIYKHVDQVDNGKRKQYSMSDSIWTNKTKSGYTVKVELPNMIQINGVWSFTPNMESIVSGLRNELHAAGYETKRKADWPHVLFVYVK